MKKQLVDAKKAAANDKENGNGKKVSNRTKPAADEKYTIGSIETVKRGDRRNVPRTSRLSPVFSASVVASAV